MSDYRYWAFISYSHADEAWARWLHKALETWRVPHRLVGSTTPMGPAPRRFMPIFRDRDELSSSHELGAVINKALAESRWQIVICSPRSAQSRWVNEEIRSFKSLGRSDRVLALIVDGDPHATDPALECFAPALRWQVDGDGQLKDLPAEPIAADIRTGKDGRQGAKLKLLAGMLGVGLDELIRRERRRQWLRALAWTGATVALTVGITTLYQQQRAEAARQLAQQENAASAQRLLQAGQAEFDQREFARAALLLDAARNLGAQSAGLDTQLALALQPLAGLMRDYPAHKGRVRALTFSPDGRLLASTGRDQQIRLWDVSSGEQRWQREMAKAANAVGGMRFSDDGEHLLISYSPERLKPTTVQVWNVARGELELSVPDLTPQSGLVIKSAPMDRVGRQLALLRPDGRVELWDIAAQRRLQQWRGPQPFQIAGLSADGRRAFAGDAAGVLHEWQLPSGESLRQRFICPGGFEIASRESQRGLLAMGCNDGSFRVLEPLTGALRMTGGHKAGLNDLRFSADGERLLTLSKDSLRVWRTDNGSLLWSHSQTQENNSYAAMSTDGRLVASSRSQAVDLWDVESERRLFSLDGHDNAVTSHAVGVDGRSLATGGSDGHVRLWRLDGLPLAVLRHGPSADALRGSGMNDIDFSPDGQWLATAGMDTPIRLWRRSDFGLQRVLEGHTAPVADIEFSTDGTRLLSTDMNHLLHIWEIPGGRLLHTLRGHDNTVIEAHFNADGSRILSSGWDNRACLWDSATGGKLECWTADVAYSLPERYGFSPDGQHFVLGSQGRIEFRASQTGKLVWELPAVTSAENKLRVIDFARFDRSGRQLMVARGANQLLLLDAETGQLRHQAQADPGTELQSAEFDPGGTRIALGSGAAQALLWTPATGSLLPFGRHEGPVRWARWSPDGRLLLTTGNDGRVRLADAANPNMSFELTAHAIAALARFAPDGRTVVSYGEDNLVRVTALPPLKIAAGQVAQHLRCLTPWVLDGEVLRLQAIQREGCAALAPTD